MGGFKASIEPISGFKPANNQDYPLYNWHHVFTGNPNDQNDDTRLDDTIREINETLDGAVLYSEAQNLTEAQKQQARDNIGASTGAVLYSQAQTLTDAQKQQARQNIGAVQVDATLTQTGQAADAKKTGDEISGLKADLRDLSDWTGYVDGSSGFFTDAQKAVDSVVGADTLAYDVTNNVLNGSDVRSSAAASGSIGINFGDFGLTNSNSLIDLNTYPIFKFSVSSNVPSTVDIHFAIWAYNDTGGYSIQSYSVTNRSGVLQTLNVAEWFTSLGLSSNYHNAYVRNIASDSMPIESGMYLNVTSYGFFPETDESTSLIDRLAVLEPPAAASDVGKALKVKTVSDGKVSEYEFGDAVTIDNTLTQPGQAADAKAAGDELTGLKADLSDIIDQCKDGTGILIETGFFTDAQRAVDAAVGFSSVKYADDALNLKFSRSVSSPATGTGSINLGDYSLTADDNKISLLDYPYVVFQCTSDIPGTVRMFLRVWAYVGTTTIYRTVEIDITNRVGDKIIFNLRQHMIDLGYPTNDHVYIRGVFTDSFTYTNINIDFKLFGFFTNRQGETYNLALKYADTNTRLSDVEMVAERAITGIGEVNLANESGFMYGLLDPSSGEVTLPSLVNASQTSDYIEIDDGEKYNYQAWTKIKPDGGTYLVRICYYSQEKVFMPPRIDNNNYTPIIIGDKAYVQGTLDPPSNAKYCKICVNAFGYLRLKVERGNAVTDWSPGLDIIISAKAWNIIKQYPIYGIIHRGCGENQTAPENTIPGFIWGKKNGFDFCETDIRYTYDGVAVLLHDASINRTARNADGTEISETINISDITYSQALTYDFGIYKGVEYTGTKIPTFEEFIKLCKNINLNAYLELKAFNNDEEDLASLVNLVKTYGMQNHVVWFSGSYGPLFIVKRLDPGAALCMSMNENTYQRDLIVLKALKTSFNEVIYNVLTTNLTSEVIQDIKNCGVTCNAYCPNTSESMLLLDEFVTGVLSDKLNYETVRKNNILGTS